MNSCEHCGEDIKTNIGRSFCRHVDYPNECYDCQKLLSPKRCRGMAGYPNLSGTKAKVPERCRNRTNDSSGVCDLHRGERKVSERKSVVPFVRRKIVLPSGYCLDVCENEGTGFRCIKAGSFELATNGGAWQANVESGATYTVVLQEDEVREIAKFVLGKKRWWAFWK